MPSTGEPFVAPCVPSGCMIWASGHGPGRSDHERDHGRWPCRRTDTAAAVTGGYEEGARCWCCSWAGRAWGVLRGHLRRLLALGVGNTKSDERRARIWEVRRRLRQEGPPWTRDREADFETVTVPEPDCDQLRDLLISEGTQTVVEVGLAYASSALAIGEALVTVNPPRPQHIIIDPFQERDWCNVGWDLLCSAGLDSIASLVRAPSSIALPQLLTEGLVADAAFVDGSHRFHEVFVDLYFLRKIVRPGGLIVMDDAGAPSVRTAVRYYERNLGWAMVPGAFPPGTLTTVADVQAAPATRCRALRLPDPSFEPPFEEFHAF